MFSPERRPDLEGEMLVAGWVPIADVAGTPPRARQVVARVLSLLPTQEARAARVAIPPHLVVLEHPAWRARDQTVGGKVRATARPRD